MLTCVPACAELLHRLFMCLYDFDVIEEEVFLQWREEINFSIPGKQTALIKANRWFTWLEHAESASDDDDDEGGQSG